MNHFLTYGDLNLKFLKLKVFPKSLVIVLFLFFSASLQSCFTLVSTRLIVSVAKDWPEIEIQNMGTYTDLETDEYSVLVKPYQNRILGSTCVSGILIFPMSVTRESGDDYSRRNPKSDLVPIEFGISSKDESSLYSFSDIQLRYEGMVYFPEKSIYKWDGRMQLGKGLMRSYKWKKLLFRIANFDAKNKFDLTIKVLKENEIEEKRHTIPYEPKEVTKNGDYGERGC